MAKNVSVLNSFGSYFAFWFVLDFPVRTVLVVFWKSQWWLHFIVKVE